MTEPYAPKGEISLHDNTPPEDFYPVSRPMCHESQEYLDYAGSDERQPSLWGPVQLDLGLD